MLQICCTLVAFARVSPPFVETTNAMATIQKRKSSASGSRFTATVRVRPYPPQSKTFGRFSEAKSWAEDLESDIKNRRLKVTPSAGKRTVSELIDQFVSDTFHLRKSKQFPFTVLQFWKMQLGHYKLQDVTKSEIRSIWKAVEGAPSERTGKKLTNRTLNGYIEPLSACFSFAVNELEWLDSNPCQGMRRKSVAGNWRMKILTPNELTELLAAVSLSANSYLLPVVLICLSTGARKSEVLGLDWSDLNLSTGSVTFRNTKNGYDRTVMLSDSALRALQKHSKLRRLDSSLVFPSRKPLWKEGKGTSSRPWEDVKKPFDRALKIAGIENFRFHDLRHCAASLLIASGASLEEVGKILGHRTPQMTWRYASLIQVRNKELVNAVDDRFMQGRLVA